MDNFPPFDIIEGNHIEMNGTQRHSTLMKNKSKRDVEKAWPRDRFISSLRRLADALEAGRPFTIQVSGERIPVPVSAVVSIEHERSGASEELEFQLKWNRAPKPTA